MRSFLGEENRSGWSSEISTAARTKRRVIICIAAAVLILVLIQAGPNQQPSYKGKPLTTRLLALDSLKSDEAGDAIEAVSHVGARCLPTLLRMVRSRDSASKTLLINFLAKHSVFHLSMRSSDQKHHESYVAFLVLRDKAEVAIPELSKLLRSKDSDVQNCALKCLLAIGPKSLPALEEARRDSDKSISGLADNALSIFETEGTNQNAASALN